MILEQQFVQIFSAHYLSLGSCWVDRTMARFLMKRLLPSYITKETVSKGVLSQFPLVVLIN